MTRTIRRLGSVLLCFALSIPSFAAGYTQTKYPIVLVHGLFGFDKALGVDYFNGVASALQKDGARVFIADVSAVNGNAVRGEQLLSQVKQILAITGAQKVNLIGHSQGAPTSRYVAAVAPQLVASVSTVGGVNKGSKFADVVAGTLPNGSISNSVASSIANAFGSLVALVSGHSGLPQDAKAALYDLSTPGMNAFNAKYPAGVPTTACGQGAAVANGVRYYSWSGSSTLTHLLDASDALLVTTGLAFGGEANDGLVSACATHLGTVIRDNYTMNHADEINQLFGLVSWFETSPVTLFRQHANRLQQAGV
ncbi:triacylglycerol lipase [Burkholderiaceae bacterium DAT-1]|nr:triacylglycerol lipase [Burkholderiaceae bacterium DAT-1]